MICLCCPHVYFLRKSFGTGLIRIVNSPADFYDILDVDLFLGITIEDPTQFPHYYKFSLYWSLIAVKELCVVGILNFISSNYYTYRLPDYKTKIFLIKFHYIWNFAFRLFRNIISFREIFFETLVFETSSS